MDCSLSAENVPWRVSRHVSSSSIHSMSAIVLVQGLDRRGFFSSPNYTWAKTYYVLVELDLLSLPHSLEFRQLLGLRLVVLSTPLLLMWTLMLSILLLLLLLSPLNIPSSYMVRARCRRAAQGAENATKQPFPALLLFLEGVRAACCCRSCGIGG